jgi:hypothetical protein
MTVPRCPPEVTITNSSCRPGGVNTLSAAAASSGVRPRARMISSSGVELAPTVAPPAAGVALRQRASVISVASGMTTARARRTMRMGTSPCALP